MLMAMNVVGGDQVARIAVAVAAAMLLMVMREIDRVPKGKRSEATMVMPISLIVARLLPPTRQIVFPADVLVGRVNRNHA